MVYTGKIENPQTCPYRHRLSQVNFIKDRTIITFDDLVSRSRYTGGYYGRSTKRKIRLHRGYVRTDGNEIVVSFLLEEGGIPEWLVKLSVKHGLEIRKHGVVFPTREFELDNSDLLPVFHQEKSLHMSIAENFSNGDRLSEFIKLYLMAYILGMLARYFPSHWMDVVRDSSSGADHHLLLHATRAVQEIFAREFAEQLAIVTDDPYFFGEHFGETESMFAGDWRDFASARFNTS